MKPENRNHSFAANFWHFVISIFAGFACLSFWMVPVIGFSAPRWEGLCTSQDFCLLGWPTGFVVDWKIPVSKLETQSCQTESVRLQNEIARLTEAAGFDFNLALENAPNKPCQWTLSVESQLAKWRKSTSKNETFLKEHEEVSACLKMLKEIKADPMNIGAFKALSFSLTQGTFCYISYLRLEPLSN